MKPENSFLTALVDERFETRPGAILSLKDFVVLFPTLYRRNSVLHIVAMGFNIEKVR